MSICKKKERMQNLIIVGHPDEKSFYFCGRSSLKDFSYCKLHLLYAYQPKGKKEEITDKEEVPDFIEKIKIPPRIRTTPNFRFVPIPLGN